jgi:hypothetical protein
MLCLSVEASFGVAIYVPFGSTRINIRSGLGACDCDVSCIGATKTLMFVPIKNVDFVGITKWCTLIQKCTEWTTLKCCL